MTEQAYFYGTGRRKSAIARVRLLAGGGAIIINGKPLEEIFPQFTLQSVIVEPLRVTDTSDKFNAVVKVEGGGDSGQAGAIRHGIARALLKADETLKPLLRQHGLLTRDPRVKERKKYGLKRARKAPQYTKR
ncbi:MAG TPA: 30S ribosomal protein S9 [Dehalococcoidia bacterium]|nr:30S ribosomal protein S9 [Dehalococcoidia bacterium]